MLLPKLPDALLAPDPHAPLISSLLLVPKKTTKLTASEKPTLSPTTKIPPLPKASMNEFTVSVHVKLSGIVLAVDHTLEPKDHVFKTINIFLLIEYGAYTSGGVSCWGF